MGNQGSPKIQLRNSQSILEIDMQGGAIPRFQLIDSGVNPLNFELPAAADGTLFKGHFLCLGRWGDPSAGEYAAGVVKHGDFFRRPWNVVQQRSNREINMAVVSPVEGMQLERQVILDEESPVFFVREAVTNINQLGRFYNMVQHPTIAAPFLNDATRVFSNAATGICQGESNNGIYSQWPIGMPGNGVPVDLSSSGLPDNNIFSFIVKPGAAYGWLVAWSPANRLLMGYIWPRADYPWINFWQYSENNRICYRGLEFGTSGIHAPLHQIVASDRAVLLGEQTVRFIDAGEKITTSYISFLAKTSAALSPVLNVEIDNKEIIISSEEGEIKIALSASIRLY